MLIGLELETGEVMEAPMTKPCLGCNSMASEVGYVKHRPIMWVCGKCKLSWQVDGKGRTTYWVNQEIGSGPLKSLGHLVEVPKGRLLVVKRERGKQ